MKFQGNLKGTLGGFIYEFAEFFLVTLKYFSRLSVQETLKVSPGAF